jgi:hypothetical protein
LADAGRALAEARAAYETNQIKLRQANAAVADAGVSSEKREAAIREIETLTSQLEQNNRELDLKKSQTARAVEPVEPSEADIRTVGDPIDNRAKLGLAASGGIFIVFAGWIMMTLRGAARESHYAYTPAFETLETPTTPVLEPQGAEAEENEAAIA